MTGDGTQGLRRFPFQSALSLLEGGAWCRADRMKRSVAHRTLARLRVSAWILLAGIATGAQAGGSWPASPIRLEGVAAHHLANGVQLVLAPDASKSTTTVNVTYRVGSLHERDGEFGTAHVVEHLIYRGTSNSGPVHREFSRRGVSYDGSTTADRTSYVATFAADDDTLRWYLGWQADAMFNSLVSESDFAEELNIIRNEMDRGDSNRGRLLIQRAMAVMHDWHPYGRSTIGMRSDLEAMNLDRARAFYRRHYRPENVTIVVAGHFDPEFVLRLAGESFAPLASGAPAPGAASTQEPRQDGERSVTLRRAGGTPIVAIGFHIPSAAHPDFAAATLLAGVLANRPEGRLQTALVRTGQATAAFAFTMPLRDPSALFFGVTLPGDGDPGAARGRVLEVLARLDTELVTEAEVVQTRERWLNAWKAASADPESLAVQLADASARGDWRLHFTQRDLVRGTTTEAVRSVVRRYLVSDNRTVAIYLPTRSAAMAPEPGRVGLDAAGRTQLELAGDDRAADPRTGMQD